MGMGGFGVVGLLGSFGVVSRGVVITVLYQLVLIQQRGNINLYPDKPLNYQIRQLQQPKKTHNNITQKMPKMDQSEPQQQQQQLTLLDQFKQQMLKAWQPVPTLTKTIIMFFILSAIFLGLGIPMMILSSTLQEYSVRYDQCSITTSGGVGCVVGLKIDQDMVGPIFVYYQVRNYYQNHRLYAKSINYKQLKGQAITLQQAQTDCQPYIYNKNIPYIPKNVNGQLLSINGSILDPNAVAIPCGTVAATIFNDTFTLNNNSGSIPIISTGIAWPSDKLKFKNSNPAQMWYDVQSERFMNWVRIASMPSFRKLWGKIQGNLAKGNYTIDVINYFNVAPFGGQKYFVISQSNFFGSKNDFLSITYLVVGGLCLLIGMLFLGKKIIKNKSQ